MQLFFISTIPLLPSKYATTRRISCALGKWVEVSSLYDHAIMNVMVDPMYSTIPHSFTYYNMQQVGRSVGNAAQR